MLRRAMFAGAAIVIALIGLSLLLTALEQLRERRRLLAVLVAFGTRRSTLGWSLLWQSAVPVGARARGRGPDRPRPRRGAAADRRHRLPRRLARRARRWSAVGAAVVVLVTAASLPVLFRTMRPEGLRTE